MVEGKIFELAIAMPFILKIAKGPVYKSIDIKTGKEVNMSYGIKFLGLGPHAMIAYNNNLYDYLNGCPNINLIKTIILIAKKENVNITQEWLFENLINERFTLISSV